MKTRAFTPFIIRPHSVRFSHTRLLDQTQKYLDDVSVQEALAISRAAELDLVCFSAPEKNELALCKVIDYGKWKYHEAKKLKQKKSTEKKKQSKEIRFSPNIDDNDVDHKLKQLRGFLEEGCDVVVSMRIKGRQRAYFREAEIKLDGFIARCSDIGKEVSRKKSPGYIAVRIIPEISKEE